MVNKESLFQQLASMIASAHQLHFDMTKDMPMGDITPLQYEILELVSVKQPITASQLSECKGISMPNMSRELRKLKLKGLCEGIEDTGDRRKQYIRLSPLGEERIAAAFEHMRQLFMQRIEQIPDSKLAKISEAMGILDSTIFRAESE
ncbi:MarR family transcriptional regulator [Paenibacillus sp. YPG26]|uniref:MarR family winged helix-turn-helix transcriptional regulator n=1 Tax=Paenibacillus sp. YPG26 TaxID=2878915 RepID=UPI00203ABA49|nr:MarR family transcriptional regulator [Paenibacillus sp. YPG26]USB32688.1 MarR family transcriptional regulator [Paenibacillus sp. YPG26]